MSAARIAPLLVAATLLLASCSQEAAAPAVTAASPPDLSGYWELRADSKHVTEASVTPEGKALAASSLPKVTDGNSFTHASRWCQHLGVPFLMGNSAPLSILQTKSEIAIIAEVQSAARHVYLDGRAFPDAEVFEPTTNGFSVGHWEGDVLVIETRGFNALGNPAIPGGGARSPTSKLTERFQLKEGGQQLSVTSTWEDPKVFTQPHTYDFTYYRAPPDTYALEYFCDASDPLRTKTAEMPVQ
jgi:hypothetical protein